MELDQAAKTSATISTVGFAVGGGVLAAGALLWLIAPSPAKAQGAPAAGFVKVEPRVGGASLAIGGAF
ncbi:MAG: hypothetical protein R3B70_14845 [Polyangiaceae bacterium]